MSDEAQTESKPLASDADIRDQIAAMQAEIVRLKTNPRDLPVRIHCNVCGDDVEDGKRCSKHPNDKLNHVREDSVLAKQV